MNGQLAWFLCQGVVVFGSGFVLSFCLRRKTSECLRRFWCGVWLALVLLPLATLVLPKWSVRAPVVREFAAPSPLIEMEPVPAIAEVPLPSFDEPLDIAVVPKRSLSQILVQLWTMVAGLLLLRLFVSQVLLLRLRWSSDAAPLKWQESLSALAPSPMPKLRMSSRARVPMTWGLVRPVIMIPKCCEDHPEEKRSFVLCHECQHLAQNDTRWLALAQVILCLHWANPLAWLAMKRLRLAQEKSCDEAVVRADNAAVSYADFLLQAAKHTHRSLFRPLALAVVPSRQNALKQRLTNILTPTMKTKPSKRLSASLVVLVTAVCLTLATLGWRTPTIAHEISDPDLQEKLEAKMLEKVELDSAPVKEAIGFLKEQLKELDVNIVLLRGAHEALKDGHRGQAILEHMIKRQEDETEEARLKMLDLAERYRITPGDADISAARLRQSDENMLAKAMAISKEKMRIEKLSGLDGDALMRFIGDELPSNPFLDSAVQGYVRAKEELELFPVSGATDKSPQKGKAERQVELHQQRIAEEVSAVRALLKTKLDMAERELMLAKHIVESEKDSLMDERRKMAEYDASRRHYDRQLAALDDLEQRRLDARLSSAQIEESRVDLNLTNVSLADAMTYALQLAGLDYRLRRNTVVIGTPAELKAM